jgi:hypothetical protein
VADILGRHVRLAVEGIDRMYLNVYVPRLQCERGVVGFKTIVLVDSRFVGKVAPTPRFVRFPPRSRRKP